MEHRRNIGTPGTVAEQRNTPEHQWNTLKYHRNTNVTPAEHLGTTEPYKTKNNCSDFKENLSLINTNKINKQAIKLEKPLQRLASNITRL